MLLNHLLFRYKNNLQSVNKPIKPIYQARKSQNLIVITNLMDSYTSLGIDPDIAPAVHDHIMNNKEPIYSHFRSA